VFYSFSLGPAVISRRATQPFRRVARLGCLDFFSNWPKAVHDVDTEPHHLFNGSRFAASYLSEERAPIERRHAQWCEKAI